MNLNIITVFAAALLLCACTDDTATDSTPADTSGDTLVDDSAVSDAAAPLSCEELDLAFGALVGLVLETYSVCAGCTDGSDCELVEPALTCPSGAQVTLCQVTLATGQTAVFLAQLATDAAPLCDRVTEPCISSASCAAVSAVVTGDRCELSLD